MGVQGRQDAERAGLHGDTGGAPIAADGNVLRLGRGVLIDDVGLGELGGFVVEFVPGVADGLHLFGGVFMVFEELALGAGEVLFQAPGIAGERSDSGCMRTRSAWSNMTRKLVTEKSHSRSAPGLVTAARIFSCQIWNHSSTVLSSLLSPRRVFQRAARLVS